MKFIHAVIFDKSEYDELREYGVDFENWDDITDGDYIVHCLYDVDNETILVHEDNTHQPVETIIESFLDGIEYANSINVGGIMIPNEINKVVKAYIVVDNGLSYCSAAVGLCLVEGAYVEMATEMKWYIENPYGIPLHWNKDIIEFDSKEDAERFKEGAEQIPFLTTDVHYVIQHPRCPKKYINMSGLVPVANGDDIELKRWKNNGYSTKLC